jgi:hypothetical protein
MQRVSCRNGMNFGSKAQSPKRPGTRSSSGNCAASIDDRVMANESRMSRWSPIYRNICDTA